MTSIVERLQFTLWTLMQPLTEMQRPAVKWEKARKGEETISENFLFIVAKEKVHFSFWGPAPTISLSEEKKNSLTDYCAEKPWERRCWWEKAFSMSFYCAFLGLIGRKQSRLYSVWIRWPEKRRRTLFSELQYSKYWSTLHQITISIFSVLLSILFQLVGLYKRANALYPLY